jgi:hypothetical protein
MNTEPIAYMFEQMPRPRKPGAKKPGRPRNLTHPLAAWVEENYEGDRDRLAAEAGISRGHLDGVLSGVKFFGRETAKRVSGITGIPVELLI